MPTAFADTRELTGDELASAPVRWPRPSELARALTVTPNPAAAAAEALGLTSIGALLEHLPRQTGEARTVEGLAVDETATVIVEVRSIRSRPVRRRGMKPLVVATVADATGTMQATFFNQPWLERQYAPGARVMLSGKYQGAGRFRVNAHARTDAVGGEEGAPSAAPQYPVTKGITSTQVLALVREHAAAIKDFPEPLAGSIRASGHLPDRPAAIAAAHFGDSEDGRRRLAFEELLVDQLVQLRLQARSEEGRSARALAEPPAMAAGWLSGQLPFEPTGDQLAAIAEIDADLAKTRPMNRMLMGEVGSGKTVVALYAMLRAAEHGAQAALMAPTETLAEQHFATIQKLLGDTLISVELLTGATTAARRRALLGRLATGELSLVVGTHALIEPDVEFNSLAVAVVDEQHRFGVRQRAALEQRAGGGENAVPHLLHMTATPIPRTLRLASFGALDVTTLRELPSGRQPIATHVCSSDGERARAYERIREELDAGRQAFVVCPLVSESEVLNARAATDEFERLREGELADYELALLHGQMKSAEKQAVMERFSHAGAQVLVATTVIEVGIDVPNATVMLIEDAERYGISQLHQLRGRVGRGEHKSLCLLFGPKESQRLKALAEHSDGFRLAEIDLELRGEGELTGTRQSGLARYRFARLPDDAAVLEDAHSRAQALAGELDDDPRHALLAALVAEREAEALRA
ncbi:MAG: ATP-dependent DNA helicase RecG [Baekduia sp.]